MEPGPSLQCINRIVAPKPTQKQLNSTGCKLWCLKPPQRGHLKQRFCCWVPSPL